jgi:hypothetical protein
VTPGNVGFWWRWVVANCLGELLGLGAVAAAGYALLTVVGEPSGIVPTLLYTGTMVALGAVEGLVVGWAQSRVLSMRITSLHGWITATVLGAVTAWLLGMLPSTILELGGSTANGSQTEPGALMQLGLAMVMGLVAGPVLALFQWRVLRRYVQHAGRWIAANAFAWALGMPVIFIGMELVSRASSATAMVTVIALTLAAAGAIVGMVHGIVIVRLTAR